MIVNLQSISMARKRHNSSHKKRKPPRTPVQTRNVTQTSQNSNQTPEGNISDSANVSPRKSLPSGYRLTGGDRAVDRQTVAQPEVARAGASNGTVNQSRRIYDSDELDGINPNLGTEQRMQRVIDDMNSALGIAGAPQPSSGTNNQEQNQLRVNEIAQAVIRPEATPAIRQNESAGAWSHMFAGSRMAAKGKSLAFIPPTVENGVNCAKLQQSEIEILAERRMNALIVYIVGDTPTIANLHK